MYSDKYIFISQLSFQRNIYKKNPRSLNKFISGVDIEYANITKQWNKIIKINHTTGYIWQGC